MTHPVLPQEVVDCIIAHLDLDEKERLPSLLACGLASKSTLAASRRIFFRIVPIDPRSIHTLTSLVAAPANTISSHIQEFKIERSSFNFDITQSRKEKHDFAKHLDDIVPELTQFCGVVFSGHSSEVHTDIYIFDVIRASRHLRLVSKLSLLHLGKLGSVHTLSELLSLFPRLTALSLAYIAIDSLPNLLSPPSTNFRNGSFVIEQLPISSPFTGYLQWFKVSKPRPLVEDLTLYGGRLDAPSDCKHENDILGLVGGNLRSLRMLEIDSPNSFLWTNLSSLALLRILTLDILVLRNVKPLIEPFLERICSPYLERVTLGFINDSESIGQISEHTKDLSIALQFFRDRREYRGDIFIKFSNKYSSMLSPLDGVFYHRFLQVFEGQGVVTKVIRGREDDDWL